MDSLSEVFEALFMEGPYRFALQCVCKIERLFSVNVIRTSCLEVATSARVWVGAIVLVLACELARRPMRRKGALRVQAVTRGRGVCRRPGIVRSSASRKWLGIRRGF